MEFSFYICSLIAILATLRLLIPTNPMHALLYFIISLLAISGIFFSLGAHFAGALEIIVYAGAIMVLFVFVVMTLNLDESKIYLEKNWRSEKVWFSPIIVSFGILIVIVYAAFDVDNEVIYGTPISAKEVGIALFGPYLVTVELASMLLLSGLVVVLHVGRSKYQEEILENHQGYNLKRKTEKHI